MIALRVSEKGEKGEKGPDVFRRRVSSQAGVRISPAETFARLLGWGETRYAHRENAPVSLLVCANGDEISRVQVG